MKHFVLLAVIMAVFCCGAYAQETTPETKAPEASLKAAADNFCSAGLKGDFLAVFDFMIHPAMRQLAAEASGFENVQDFLDSMKILMDQQFAENPLQTCAIDSADAIECPSYAIVHFETFGLTVQKCGKIALTLKTTQDEEAQTQDFTTALIDGAWYAVIEDPDTGIDYSDTEENDMGLRDFAKEFCAAMESQDPAAMESFRMPGIEPAAPSPHQDIINWSVYMGRLAQSWKMNPEPVSCNVMSTENMGSCTPETTAAYQAAGLEAITCGILDLGVFMDKDNWYNGLSAVFVDGAWHIDPNDLIELSRIAE
jgi:hypothetical protein